MAVLCNVAATQSMLFLNFINFQKKQHMSLNLMDLVKSQLGSGLMSTIAGHLGESEARTQSAVDGGLASIIGGLMGSASTTQSATSLLNLLMGKQQSSTSMGDLLGMISGGGSSIGSLIQLGGPLLKTVFGDKLGGVVDAVSSSSGASKQSTSSLLGILAPLVMGALGKTARDGGFNIGSLVGLLMGQKNHIQAAAPAGLASALGFSSFDSLFNSSKVTPIGYTAGGGSSSSSDNGGGGFMKWLLPLVLLGLLGFGAMYFMKGCGKDAVDQTVEGVGGAVDAAGNAVGDAANAVGGAADSLATAAGNAAGGAVDAAGNAVGGAVDAAGKAVGGAVDAAGEATSAGWAALGKLMKRKLADGTELNVPEKGVENKLISFIEDKTKMVDKTTWFSFDRLLFETGKSTLKPESAEQVKNMAAILKAFPQVEIKLGGYTDNTGDAKKNLALSGERAKTVKAELVKLGTDAKRIATEGYGQEHPVADNATPEGRAQNRRIDVRVTKK